MTRPQARPQARPCARSLRAALCVTALCAAALSGCQSSSSAPAPAPTTLQAPPTAPGPAPSTMTAPSPPEPAPPPPPVALDPGHDDALIRGLPAQGAGDAPYLLLAFVDPEDPADRNFLRELDLLRQSMPPDALLVRLGLYPKDTKCNKHISRTLSESGCVSARALLCAHDLNLFWPMLYSLRLYFEERDRLPPERRAIFLTEGDAQSMLSQFAQADPKPDLNAFSACLTDPSTDVRLAALTSRAADLGIGSTPAWRVNGVTPSIPALSASHKLQAFIEAQPKRALPTPPPSP